MKYEDNLLSEKDLVRATGAPPWVIRYLRDAGRLPVAVPSQGRGYPTVYAKEAKAAVLEHLQRRKGLSPSEMSDDLSSVPA